MHLHSSPHRRALSLLRRHHRLVLPHLHQIHAVLATSGALSDPFAAAGLVSAFALPGRASDLRHADLLFHRLPSPPNAFAWNTFLRAHLDHSLPRPCLSLYPRMLSQPQPPNNYTFSFLLRACADLPAPRDGRKLHAHVFRLGWEPHEFVRNGLIDMYGQSGSTEDARKVFDESPQRDVISWTALASGYARSGQMDAARELFDWMPERNSVSWSVMINGYACAGACDEALSLFAEMQLAGVTPNRAAIVGALTACASAGALDQGRWIHAYAARNGVELDTVLGTALVDMYAKCGLVDAAWAVFAAMPAKDVFAYSAMISGLSVHGRGEAALELFHRMQEENLEPNWVTFICVLGACARLGLVSEGKRIFDSMSGRRGIRPGVEHYGCMVDLLGRVGMVKEARRVVEGMPMEPDKRVLGALLNACRVHGDVELGREVVGRLEELGLADAGAHVLLSNMYASGSNWEEAVGVRRGMDERSVRKVRGCSVVQVDGVCFDFAAGDWSPSPLDDDHLMLVMMQLENHLKSTLDRMAFDDCFSCYLE